MGTQADGRLFSWAHFAGTSLVCTSPPHPRHSQAHADAAVACPDEAGVLFKLGAQRLLATNVSWGLCVSIWWRFWHKEDGASCLALPCPEGKHPSQPSSSPAHASRLRGLCCAPGSKQPSAQSLPKNSWRPGTARQTLLCQSVLLPPSRGLVQPPSCSKLPLPTPAICCLKRPFQLASQMSQHCSQ